jgi:hypothetical protein
MPNPVNFDENCVMVHGGPVDRGTCMKWEYSLSGHPTKSSEVAIKNFSRKTFSGVLTMRKTLFGTAIALSLSAGSVAAAVSISVGEPGFYGRIDIGNDPPPQVVYAKPIVVQPVRGAAYDPIYLRVPPGHARNWRNYCHRYDACGRPVYFVQDRWYNEVYAPRYRERHHGRRGDRDRDGVPDRVDRDRDGDGVPNRQDRRPDNARRY